MQISDTTELILLNPAKAAAWLEAADRYRTLYLENPEQFILPAQNAVLAPLLEAYANNLGGMTRYMAGIRDELKRQGYDNEAEAVHTVYRKVYIRYMQQHRRERSTRALAKAVELHGDAPFQTRLAWTARMEHIWARRRLAYLSAARKGNGGRLDIIQKNEALADFWDLIDQEIQRGERIPPWN